MIDCLKPVLSFSVSAGPADTLVYYALAFNIFLSSIVSAKLADTPIREIFVIPADSLSNLTFFPCQFQVKLTGTLG